MTSRHDNDDVMRTPGMEQCPPNGDGEQCPQAPALRSIRRDTQDILLILRGDNTEERPGLLMRVDRMERDLALMQKIVYGAVLLILLAFMAAVIGFVFVNQKVNKVAEMERSNSSDTYATTGFMP